MKMLSNDAKSLLDKLYNLRGEDSVILAKMNKEREEAIETGERTKNEKAVLLEKIEKLTLEEQTLQEEGAKLTAVLSSINRDEFATVLDRLQIDFDPSSINDKLNTMLPETIEKVVSENKLASEELENVETEMNNAFTKVEELGIRKDEALGNQAKLNEYFDLALAGNINITRDAITGLLEKFDFNEDEQREAAKILMFPEDALYEYDAAKKSVGDKPGRTITDILVEAKKESQEDVVEETAAVEATPVTDKVVEEIAVPDGDAELEQIFEKVIEESSNDIKDDAKEDNEALFKDSEEDISSNDTDVDKNKVVEFLRGLDVYNITDESIDKLVDHYNEDLIRKNIGILKKHNVDVDVVRRNAEILYDAELNEKLEMLLKIGKLASDISLMPTVLVKYDLKGLNNTINVLQISGLDPKQVPLMAY